LEYPCFIGLHSLTQKIHSKLLVGILRQQQDAGLDVQQWIPPCQGYVKCNVDASFYNTAGATGWGRCLRDHRGRFILAESNVIQGRLNTIEGEAMTMREAIQEVMQRGFTHMIFESDSQIVIDVISSSRHGVSEFSTLISQIQSLLLLVSNFEVKFVRRQANLVHESLPGHSMYVLPSFLYVLH
jgi:ribonuclease HI